MSRTDSSAQHSKIGIVKEIHGDNLFATDPHGDARPLSVGSPIYADDQIEAREGSSMVVLTNNGQAINIPEDVYDQMLTKAIAKELSTALHSDTDSADIGNAEPHSHNTHTSELYAENTINASTTDEHINANSKVIIAKDLNTENTQENKNPEKEDPAKDNQKNDNANESNEQINLEKFTSKHHHDNEKNHDESSAKEFPWTHEGNTAIVLNPHYITTSSDVNEIITLTDKNSDHHMRDEESHADKNHGDFRDTLQNGDRDSGHISFAEITQHIDTNHSDQNQNEFHNTSEGIDPNYLAASITPGFDTAKQDDESNQDGINEFEDDENRTRRGDDDDDDGDDDDDDDDDGDDDDDDDGDDDDDDDDDGDDDDDDDDGDDDDDNCGSAKPTNPSESTDPQKSSDSGSNKADDSFGASSIANSMAVVSAQTATVHEQTISDPDHSHDSDDRDNHTITNDSETLSFNLIEHDIVDLSKAGHTDHFDHSTFHEDNSPEKTTTIRDTGNSTETNDHHSAHSIESHDSSTSHAHMSIAQLESEKKSAVNSNNQDDKSGDLVDNTANQNPDDHNTITISDASKDENTSLNANDVLVSDDTQSLNKLLNEKSTDENKNSVGNSVNTLSSHDIAVLSTHIVDHSAHHADDHSHTQHGG